MGPGPASSRAPAPNVSSRACWLMRFGLTLPAIVAAGLAIGAGGGAAPSISA
jgi:hypothetical protein